MSNIIRDLALKHTNKKLIAFEVLELAGGKNSCADLTKPDNL